MKFETCCPVSNPCGEHATPTQKAIHQAINSHLSLARFEGANLRHVEAFMRLDHPTLDALSPNEFAKAIQIASERATCSLCPEDAEALANSYGL